MKRIIILALSLFTAAFAACTADPDIREEAAAPEFRFSLPETSFSVDVDSTVLFAAEMVKGTRVKTSWSVNGEKVAGTPSVKWKFTELGVSTVSFLASNSLGKVEKEYTVTVTGIPLKVRYSIPEDAAEAIVGTSFEVSVLVEGGDKGTVHAWTLDGAAIGDGLSISRTFTEEEIGTHTLEYKGRNSDGMTASKTWTITVRDLPLEVGFLPAETEITQMETKQVNFSATIVHGATGAVWSWKVDGTEVSTGSAYTHTCNAQGVFTVSATVTNAIGEKAEKTWTLTVTEKTIQSLLFDNFESTAPGVSSFYIGNNVGGVSILQVVENPYKTAANPSDKVLVDKGSMMSGSSSGYFKFKVTTYPDAVTPVPERSTYTKVRVKVYLGTTGFTPLLQADITGNPRSAPSVINGVAFDPVSPSLSAWNAAIKTDDWNVLVYDFSNSKYGDSMNHLGNTEQLQFRVFVDFNNSGKAGADVYFDDFEFIE